MLVIAGVRMHAKFEGGLRVYTLTLRLSYFGQIMRRQDSLEKRLMRQKVAKSRKRGKCNICTDSVEGPQFTKFSMIKIFWNSLILTSIFQILVALVLFVRAERWDINFTLK